jgi:hypothetical protein
MEAVVFFIFFVGIFITSGKKIKKSLCFAIFE